MNWLDALLIFAVLIAMILGVAAGGFLAARQPAFWAEMISALGKAALPKIIAYLVLRNPPDIEKKMRDCVRRGGEWDNFKKKCRDK